MNTEFRNQIDLDDDALLAKFGEVARIGLGDVEEDLSFGPASEMLRFKEARRRWSQPGTVIRSDDEVFHVEGAQAFKGQRRRDIVIIRFGDVVAIHGLDK
jgi:hypothetical protein